MGILHAVHTYIHTHIIDLLLKQNFISFMCLSEGGNALNAMKNIPYSFRVLGDM